MKSEVPVKQYKLSQGFKYKFLFVTTFLCLCVTLTFASAKTNTSGLDAALIDQAITLPSPHNLRLPSTSELVSDIALLVTTQNQLNTLKGLGYDSCQELGTCYLQVKDKEILSLQAAGFQLLVLAQAVKNTFSNTNTAPIEKNLYGENTTNYSILD